MFLCGKDKYTGVSYEHRRQWVEDRLHLLAACMTYVDLNPVIASITETPEALEQTNIHCRINTAKADKSPKILMPFVGNLRVDLPFGLPFVFRDYLKLVDISGRHIAKGKKRV